MKVYFPLSFAGLLFIVYILVLVFMSIRENKKNEWKMNNGVTFKTVQDAKNVVDPDSVHVFYRGKEIHFPKTANQYGIFVDSPEQPRIIGIYIHDSEIRN